MGYHEDMLIENLRSIGCDDNSIKRILRACEGIKKIAGIEIARFIDGP